MNLNGTPENLVAAHPGNKSRLLHGLFAVSSEPTPEAERIADAIMELPHVVPADRIGAERLGMLVVQIGRIEAALSDGKVESRQGKP